MSRPRTRQEFARRVELATDLLFVNTTAPDEKEKDGPLSIYRSEHFSIGYLSMSGRRIGVAVRVRRRLVGLGCIDWTAASGLGEGYQPRPIGQRIADRYRAAKVKVAASL